MNIPATLIWGFAATTVLTAMLRSSQALGFSRMDLPLLLGLLFTPNRDRAKVYGSFVHLLNGWAFTVIYVVLFNSTGRSGAWLGAIIGGMHGLMVLLIALPILPGLHPRMASDATGPEPTRELEPPGFLALNYGRSTPSVTLFAHIVYGAILGTFL